MRLSPSADVNSVMINPHPDCAFVIDASICDSPTELCVSPTDLGAPHLDSEMWEAGLASTPNSAWENKLACRINLRNTVSVTPAIGASTVAGRTTTEPSRTSAGTRDSVGIACSTGLSQSLFTVKPLRGILRASRILSDGS